MDTACDSERSRETRREVRVETGGLRLAAERLPALTTYERAESRRRILRCLREEIEPYARLDQPLFPEVFPRLGDPLILASLNYDHLAIRHWSELIAAADLTDTDRLQRLLYGLDALIQVNRWKENELVLALLDSPSSPALAARS